MKALSLKQLIEKYDLSLDATSIFNALERAGVLRTVEYESTTGSGEIKHFREFTAGHEAFGENRPTFHDLKTEPRFVVEAFPKLLRIVLRQIASEIEAI